jgi:ISXO2-like transposase domain
VESAFSLLKRGLIGSFHRVSIKHLHRYLTEFEYRFNERSNEARFVKTTQRLLQGKAMPYKALTGPTEA